VTNYDPDTLTLDFDLYERFGFVVSINDGTISWYPDFVTRQPNRLVIAPKEIYRVTLPLDTSKSKGDDWFLDGGKLKPGHYRISAGIEEHSYYYPWASTKFEVVR
jgi:hypothetical protein